MDSTQVFQKIAGEVARHEVSFPNTVQLALKLQHALDDPECHIDQAARLIRAEPLLASKVVALANSVAYNPAGREITDVRTAVARLGFKTIRTLAAGVVARQLATGKSPASAALAEQLWTHTAHVAALARVVARRLTHQDPETAMFAGIVHNVGGFYLLARSDDYPGLLADGMAVWADGGEAEVGRAVLSVLAVPDSVVAAIEVCWQGYLAMPPTTLGDTLLLAKELSPVASPLSGPLRDGGSASIELVVDGDVLSEILAESAAEVASLVSALDD